MKCASAFVVSSAVMGLLFSAGAVAKPVAPPLEYCNSNGSANSNGMSLSDATYGVSGPTTGPFVNSSDCYGVVLANINSASDVNGLGLTWGTNWLLGAGTDSGNETVSLTFPSGGSDPNQGTTGNFTFSMSSTGTGSTGTYTLTATDDNGATLPNLPIGLDFILAVKASDRYGLYLFSDVEMDGSGGGAWSITYQNNGGQIPAISHIDILVRADSLSSSSSSSGGASSGGNLPEPATLALIGLGLLAAAGMSRRKGARAS